MSKGGDRRFRLLVGLAVVAGVAVFIGAYAGVLLDAGDEVAAMDPNDPR